MKFFMLLVVYAAMVPFVHANENHSVKDYVIISDPFHVKTALDQCSRMTPTFITGHRELSESLVNEVDELMPDMLQKPLKNSEKADFRFSDYYRQYIAFEVLRRPYIYINGFRKDARKASIERQRGSKVWKEVDVEDWRTSAINVCGGGDDYWGVIYDVENQLVTEIIFNSKQVRRSLLR